MSWSHSISCTQLVNLISLAGFVALGGIWQRIIWQVTRAQPKYRRLLYWPWPWEDLKIFSLHREFFPDSKLRLAYWIIGTIWFPFGIIGVFRLRQALDAWWSR